MVGVGAEQEAGEEGDEVLLVEGEGGMLEGEEHRQPWHPAGLHAPAAHRQRLVRVHLAEQQQRRLPHGIEPLVVLLQALLPPAKPP